MAGGSGKMTKLSEYKVQGRGGSGIKTSKVTPKTGEVVASLLVDQEKELLVLSAKGQVIKTPLDNVRESGRATQGVRLMNLSPGDKIIGAVCL
jgi:DNA gyrase subunit A